MRIRATNSASIVTYLIVALVGCLTASDAGADKDAICNHTRLEAMRYLLTVPRGEFRLLAEPGSQPAILDAYLRQLPHDQTVIEFTGNTMSDLAIAVIAGFNWHPLRRPGRGRPQDIFGDAQPFP